MRRVLTAVLGLALLGAALTPASSAATPAEPATTVTPLTQTPSLARTPPMGWNSWNAVGCDVDQKLITDTADAIAANGMKDVGYEYVNIDDCWSLKQRDTQGRLVADPQKFPQGMKWLADYVHDRGLKLGIYGDAGTATCAGYPGSLGHEKADARTFADWGIDYLKYDNCNNEGLPAVDRYRAMGEALAEAGRPILFSICEWGANQPWNWGTSVGGQMWRTTGDITDDWDSVKSIIRKNLTLAEHAGPGHWNDPDMLQVGNGGMSEREYRTHFGMWAMMAAPLLAGTDLAKASDTTMELLLNRELVDVNQDRLGKQADVVAAEGGRYVLAKPLEDGSVALALYNENDYAATISTSAKDAGLPPAEEYTLRDLFTHTEARTTGTLRASVPAHGVVIHRVRPSEAGDTVTPARSFGLDVPLLYDGAPAPLVTPGKSATIRTRLTDLGRTPLLDARVRLEAPSGWSVKPQDRTSAQFVREDRPLATRWQVTPPAGLDPGRYRLTSTARYRLPHGRTVADTATTLVTVAKAPPPGESYLSDTEWVSSTNGWGPVERDMANGDQARGDGTPLTIDGTAYAKGLGTHAWSEAVYYTAGRCSRLTARVGVDDSQDDVAPQRGTVTFEVWKDGTKRVDTGTLSWRDPAVPIDADLEGARFVSLIATTAADGNGNDHANWADVRVSCT
ncbi:NPCBM/NEW2 domain-containing protein [Streptomyces luteolus]|uniref:Alpha-galactosidase n=1 Tax=Streptomyces luteolus TaxID=3043615 RepID=A0ABT6SPQ7_9ACTN|nr:NPCBM/NEW2 domain-containing protein [Streptomyces sp. B-S-A12]MDI3417587.1 NPCBM/NEW2 domain-containing protein [Streptomyces sp. B-S-A12]